MKQIFYWLVNQMATSAKTYHPDRWILNFTGVECKIKTLNEWQ